jgi:hypothetical protein
VWFLWEEGAFWWLSHAKNWLVRRVAERPEVALVVDTCDLRTGHVRQVLARGRAEVVPLDLGLARRKFSKYLGMDPTAWDPRFWASTMSDPETRLIRMLPATLRA